MSEHARYETRAVGESQNTPLTLYNCSNPSKPYRIGAAMKPSDFGQEYEQLLLHASAALQSSLDYTVQFTNAKVVNSVQARFRSYVRALKSTGDRPDLTALATDISTRIAGTALIFFRREDSVDAMAIRDALGLSKGFADGTDTRGVIASSTHLDTLKRIRERK